MLPNKVEFSIQGGLDFPLPKMMKVCQKFSSSELTDVSSVTRASIERLKLGNLTGKRIAITVGSRKISNIKEILKTTVTCLKEHGAFPFIVPTMGSHGQATSEGQKKILKDMDITEKELGTPIISSMDVVKIGEISCGYPIYCDRNAMEADGIVVCGRIKPHTSIKGTVESGLCKMMVVGLGKHLGATCFHRQGYAKLAELLPKGAEVFLKKANILFGLGIIEDAFGSTLKVEAIIPEEIIEREAELLKEAKENMPQILLDEIDVLIIRRIGKDISGAGMDPNITGRTITPLPMEFPLPIKYVIALDITDASYGNATGIGGADITTKDLIKKIDFEAMYTNVMTSGAFPAAKLPIVLNNDEEAIRVAIRCVPRERVEDVKVVCIQDTLHMNTIEISKNYISLLSNNNNLEIIGESEFKFNEYGRLI